MRGIAWAFAGALFFGFASTTSTSPLSRCGALDTEYNACADRVRDNCPDAACIYRRVCDECYAHAMNPYATVEDPGVFQGYARYCGAAGQPGRVEQLQAEIQACLARNDAGEGLTPDTSGETAAASCDELNRRFNADVRRYERLVADAMALRAEITAQEESLNRQCP